MFRKYGSYHRISQRPVLRARGIVFGLALAAVAAFAAESNSNSRTPEQIQAFWKGCESSADFWKQSAPQAPGGTNALGCSAGGETSPMNADVSHGIVGLNRLLNNASAPSLYQFGEDLYRNSLAVAVANYVELNYTFRGKESFSDADLASLCAGGCPPARMPEIRKSVADTLSRLKASGVKPVTPQQALDDINVRLTGLNDDLSGNVKLPSGQNYYTEKQLAENRAIYPTDERTSPEDYVDRGLTRVSYYNATSPVNDRSHATGKQRYEAYRAHYLEAVSQGAGKLLMTDALRSKTGPMVAPTQVEKDGSGRFVLRQHQVLDRSSGVKNVEAAVNEAINAARDHAANLLPPLWELQREAKKAYGPMPGPMPDMNFSGKAIAKLVGENPAIVGYMLANGHDHDHDACFAINRAKVYGDEQKQHDKLVRTGMTVFAGTLILSGAGALWGGIILSGVGAGGAAFAALGSTLSISGSVASINNNILDSMSLSRQRQQVESQFQAGAGRPDELAAKANELATQATTAQNGALKEAGQLLAFSAAPKLVTPLLKTAFGESSNTAKGGAAAAGMLSTEAGAEAGATQVKRPALAKIEAPSKPAVPAPAKPPVTSNLPAAPGTVTLEDLAKLRSESVENGQVAGRFLEDYKKLTSGPPDTLTIDGKSVKIVKVLGQGARGRVVTLADGRTIKFPTDPMGMPGFEVEAKLTKFLDENYAKYKIRTHEITHAGPNGSYLEKPLLDPKTIGIDLIKAQGGKLTVEQEKALRRLYEGTRDLARETGIGLDMKPDNVYWNGNDWVLFDAGPRWNYNPYGYSSDVPNFESFKAKWVLKEAHPSRSVNTMLAERAAAKQDPANAENPFPMYQGDNRAQFHDFALERARVVAPLPKSVSDDPRLMAALKNYQGPGYQDLNKGLRGAQAVAPADVENVKAMQEAFGQASDVRAGTRLYHGSFTKTPSRIVMKEGAEFVEPAFYSTSTNPRVSSVNFANYAPKGGAAPADRQSVFDIIEIPKGIKVKGISMTDVIPSTGKEQSEVLLQQGLRLKVIEAHKTPKGLWVRHLRVVGTESVPPIK